MKKAIITGLSGFIGGHLAAAFKKKGTSIIGLIQDTVENRQKDWGCETRFFDLTKPESLQGICLNGKTVYHLASIPREQRNISEKDYFIINTEGTHILLEEALKAGVERFIFISTIEAVGPAIDGEPLTEETPPHPENVYGRSKLAAEELVRKYNSQKMATVIVRLPMIYGPGNYLNVPKLFKAVQRPIFPILGNGLALMEFCFVGNAVQGILLAGTHERAKGETFFISEGSRSLIEVIRAVAKAVGTNPRFFYIPVPIANLVAFAIEFIATILPFPPFRSHITCKPYFSRKTVQWTTRSVNICSTEEAKNKIGFVPIYSLEEGLIQTVADFRQRNWIK